MSILQFLQLQPVEPSDDDTVSPLDYYQQDELLDLSSDIDGAALDQEWDALLNDMQGDAEKLTFLDE
jgi:hypothetical protein